MVDTIRNNWNRLEELIFQWYEILKNAKVQALGGLSEA